MQVGIIITYRAADLGTVRRECENIDNAQGRYASAATQPSILVSLSPAATKTTRFSATCGVGSIISTMPVIPESVEGLLAECQEADTASLQVHFPTSTVTKPGSQLSKADTQPTPSFSISSSAVQSNAKYIIISLDLDAPAPAISGLLSPILHGIFSDLNTQGDPDANGFVKLIADAPPAAPYGPPKPPGFSSPHRYIFLIWEQPEGLTSGDIMSRLGVADNMSLWSRIKWDEGSCEKKLGLGKPLGGNYFTV
ncbi:PEBP-like protein [Lophiostoma macrostomum CBS 122681]|uniref:PEBP-like protein n=1 Tax=Lophiostoma macrostomum CBS 122681 TaxID=1314788 RepID=A0A6A6TGY7_9PLEO|nr:PEBP-like protein [Lophiostoma macrostomum CBS 122681]